MSNPSNGSRVSPANGSPGGAGGTHPGMAALRTLALVGPAGAGKTSLVEALLHQAGALTSPGSVERGNTVSDHDPLEKRMQHSLQASLVHMQHGGIRIHAIDTPGAPDFTGQSLPALEAVDTAVVVLNAGTDLNNALKQAAEFRIARNGQAVSVFGMTINAVNAMGLEVGAVLLGDALVARLQVVVGEHGRNRDEQAERGHDQRFTDGAGDLVDRGRTGDADVDQRAIDPDHGPEQPDFLHGTSLPHLPLPSDSFRPVHS